MWLLKRVSVEALLKVVIRSKTSFSMLYWNHHSCGLTNMRNMHRPYIVNLKNFNNLECSNFPLILLNAKKGQVKTTTTVQLPFLNCHQTDLSTFLFILHKGLGRVFDNNQALLLKRIVFFFLAIGSYELGFTSNF